MKTLSRISILAVTLIASIQFAYAQEFIRLENRWKPTEQIHNQTGTVSIGATQPGWYSAQWLIEPIPGSDFFRLKNRWRGTYLHNQNGALELGPIDASWQSAMWAFENSGYPGYHRVRNRNSNEYLHNERGSLELGAIEPNWWSAQWRLVGFTGTGSAPPKAAQPPASSSGSAVVVADATILQNCPDGSKIPAGQTCPPATQAASNAAPIFCADPEFPVQANAGTWLCVSNYDPANISPVSTGCPENRSPISIGSNTYCPSPIYAAGAPPKTQADNGLRPVQIFVDQALDRCAYPGNFMFDGWNGAERPLLEAAAQKLYDTKGFPAPERNATKLFSKLQSDAVLRWEFAPFMVEEAWKALLASQPTPAQASFKNRFQVWAGCDSNLTARRALSAWNQHVGKSGSGSSINGVSVEFVDPNPQYKHPALSIFKTKGPSISGFDVTNGGNPLYIGGKGRIALSTVLEPLRAKQTPDYDDQADIALVREDFSAVSALAGIGSGGVFGGAIAFTAGAVPMSYAIAIVKKQTIAKAGIAVFDTGGDAVARIAAENAAEAGFKKFSKTTLKSAFKKAFTKTSSKASSKLATKIGLKVGVKAGAKVSSGAIGVVVFAAVAAATLGEEVAEIVQTKLYEDSLTYDAQNYSPYLVDEILGPDPSPAEMSPVYVLLLKMLIAEPADRSMLTLELPELDCPAGLILAGAQCVFNVEFDSTPSLSLAQAQNIVAQRGWVLATPAQIDAAWQTKALDKYAFGMMSDGRFAVPVQRDYSNFKKGHNIGATGGNQGFFFIRTFLEPDNRKADRAVIQNVGNLARVIQPSTEAPIRGSAGRNSPNSEWIFVKTNSGYRIQSPKNDGKFLYVRNGALKLGAIAANDPSGHWKLHPTSKSFFRLESVSLPHRYIQLKDDKLALDYTAPNDKASIWHIPLQ